MSQDDLAPALRKILELDFARFADEGHMPPEGERELVFRLDTDGRVRWFEARRIRVPASELDPRERSPWPPRR